MNLPYDIQRKRIVQNMKENGIEADCDCGWIKHTDDEADDNGVFHSRYESARKVQCAEACARWIQNIPPAQSSRL